jgi:serine/threonine protein kinase
MAPEVMKGKYYGLSADIWSVGATIIEILTGKPPFSDSPNVNAAMFRIATMTEAPPLPTHISLQCKTFLGRCMRVEPTSRASASELLVDPFVNEEYVDTTIMTTTQEESLSSTQSTVSHHHQQQQPAVSSREPQQHTNDNCMRSVTPPTSSSRTTITTQQHNATTPSPTPISRRAWGDEPHTTVLVAPPSYPFEIASSQNNSSPIGAGSRGGVVLSPSSSPLSSSHHLNDHFTSSHTCSSASTKTIMPTSSSSKDSIELLQHQHSENNSSALTLQQYSSFAASAAYTRSSELLQEKTDSQFSDLAYLTQLSKLCKQGIISEADFEAKKKQILWGSHSEAL